MTAILSLRALLRADAERSRRLQRSRFGYVPFTWWLEPGFVTVLLHRLAHGAYVRRRGKLARLIAQVNSMLTGADFHPASRLGPGVLVPAPCATTLSCTAGAGLTLMPLAGIGGSLSTVDIGAGPGVPLIGDGVMVEHFAGAFGPFTLGDGGVVGVGGGTIRALAAGGHSRPAVEPLRMATPPVAPCGGIVFPACDHARWRTTWRDWLADLDRLAREETRYSGAAIGRGKLIGAALGNPSLMLLVQRVAHHLDCRGRHGVAGWLAGLNRLLWKITVTPDACIGGGLLVPHLAGLMVDASLGRGVTLYANTIGAGQDGGPDDRPVIGDGAILGGHAAAIGPIRVGAGARLAPKVQLTVDAPPGCEAFSPLARITAAPRDAAPVAVERVDLPAIPRLSRRELRRADRERLAAWTRATGRRNHMAALAIALHRRAAHHHGRGRLRAARWTWLTNIYLTGADISPASQIAAAPLMPFPAGVSFHGRAGPGLTLMAMSAVGAALTDDDALPPLEDAPWLGAGVRLDHHAVVHGACRIGDGVRITSGCRAVDDVPRGITLVARALRFRDADARVTEPRR